MYKKCGISPDLKKKHNIFLNYKSEGNNIGIIHMPLQMIRNIYKFQNL